jgi:hypothetical protein
MQYFPKKTPARCGHFVRCWCGCTRLAAAQVESRGRERAEGCAVGGFVEVAGGSIGLVGEEDQPVLGDGAGVEAFFFFDGAQGVEVEAEAPGEGQVGGGGDEVGYVTGMIAFWVLFWAAGGLLGFVVAVAWVTWVAWVFDVDGHEVVGVAGVELDGEMGGEGVVVAGLEREGLHLTGGEQGLVVVGYVGDGVALVAGAGMGDFAGVGVVGGVGEGGDDGGAGLSGTACGVAGVPAAVVPVQVGIDDGVDAFERDTCFSEGGGEQGLGTVDLCKLWWQFLAEASFNDRRVQAGRGAGADDEGVEAEGDAVLVVAGNGAVPEGFGDDAEHGTAVEVAEAVGEDEQLGAGAELVTGAEEVRG